MSKVIYKYELFVADRQAIELPVAYVVDEYEIIACGDGPPGHFNQETAKPMTDHPNPGSDEALDLGCTCPVLDNGHGRGDGTFWICADCPIHGEGEKP